MPLTNKQIIKLTAYLALAGYMNGDPWDGLETVSDDLGISKEAVRNWLTENYNYVLSYQERISQILEAQIKREMGA